MSTERVDVYQREADAVADGVMLPEEAEARATGTRMVGLSGIMPREPRLWDEWGPTMRCCEPRCDHGNDPQDCGECLERQAADMEMERRLFGGFEDEDERL